MKFGRPRGFDEAGKEDLHLGDLSALVVTSENSDSVLEAHLKGDE